MRRLWIRLRCALGLHCWHWQTAWDPDRFETRYCSACKRQQAREWFKCLGTGKAALRDPAGFWSPWQPYEPSPEPPFGALD